MSMPAFITGGQRGGRRGAAETLAWTPGKHTSGSPPERRTWVAFGGLALALAGGDPDASEFFHLFRVQTGFDVPRIFVTAGRFLITRPLQSGPSTAHPPSM